MNHLAPGEATVGIRSTDAAGFAWASSASFRVSADGTLDLATAAARAGSYRGVWPMGLPVAMKPTAHDPAGAYIWSTLRRLRFELTVEQNGAQVAARTFERGFPGGLDEKRLNVAADGFTGVYYAPPHAHAHAGVVILGGSEGGFHTLLGAAFAAHGYPTLSLAYFKAPGLPQQLEHIPLEYFAKALRWFAKQPQVDPERIAVSGVSYGSGAALLLGVHYPAFVHAHVAIGLSPLVDQQVAGVVAKVATLPVLWTAAYGALVRAQRAEESDADTETLTWAEVERELERADRAERRASRQEGRSG